MKRKRLSRKIHRLRHDGDEIRMKVRNLAKKNEDFTLVQPEVSSHAIKVVRKYEENEKVFSRL